MRRTVTALATAALLVVATAGSGGAAPAPPTGQITCGTVGPPVCALLDQLEAQLGPVQPVLAMTSPLLGQLGSTVQQLSGLAAAPGGVPTADVLRGVQGLAAQLAALPAPARDLLGAAPVQSLQATLASVVDALTAALAPAPAPSAPGSAPRPAPAPVASPATATSSGAPTAFGGSVSAPAAEASRSTSATGAPRVPAGGTLSLAPLGLPELAYRHAPVAERPARVPAASADRLALDVASSLRSDPGDSLGYAVVVFSGLLLAAGVAAQAAQARTAARTIRD